ncbi:MAG: hypothetical protein AB8B96_01975 [Lysobacterales bacterium]
MLNRLQRSIENRYDLTPHHRVSDFVVSDPEVVKLLGANPDLSSEQLLVRQTDEDLELSLYLHRDLVDNIAALNLNQMGALIEGVSHFTYMTYCARHDRNTSQLELELQGEVDKFFGLAEHLETGTHDGRVDLRMLHSQLFRFVRWREGLSTESQQRYQAVNRLAGRLCRQWMKRFGDNIRHPHWRTEARRFYRMTQRRKLRHAGGSGN